MMKSLLKFGSVFSLILLLSSPANAGTLIGGFNGNLGSWIDTDGSSMQLVFSTTLAGQTLLPTEGYGFAMTSYGGVLRAPVSIQSRDWLSFDYATDSTDFNWAVTQPSIPFLSVNGGFVNTHGAWTPVSVDLSSLQGVTDAQISFYGAFALDNVRLGPASVTESVSVPDSASTLLLLVSGLGVVMAFKRRRT